MNTYRDVPPRHQGHLVALRILACVCLVASKVQAGGPTDGQAVQDKLSVIHVEYAPPPESLRAFYELCDAVAVVEVTRLDPVEEMDAGGGPFIKTRVTADVVEVLKADSGLSAVGRDVTLEVLGGDMPRPTGVERHVVDEFPPLIRGARYLVFLKWHRPAGAYIIAHGPFGSMLLDGDRLKPVSPTTSGPLASMKDMDAVRDAVAKIAR